jgi:hypothetical protein
VTAHPPEILKIILKPSSSTMAKWNNFVQPPGWGSPKPKEVSDVTQRTKRIIMAGLYRSIKQVPLSLYFHPEKKISFTEI